MKIAIMQPYLFPYISYFQLIKSVNFFLLDDLVKWIKEGWINRNRILLNNQPRMLALAIKHQSNYGKINEYQITNTHNNKQTFLNKIEAAYFRAPYFQKTFKLIKEIIMYEEQNISRFILNSLTTLSNALEIKTPITLLSKANIKYDSNLRGQHRVISICNKLKATSYVNPIGGTELYDEDNFTKNNLKLLFIKTKFTEYKQHSKTFVPGLSIIDLLMFNSINDVKNMLNTYHLLTKDDLRTKKK